MPPVPREEARGVFCCWSLPLANPKLTLPEVFLLLAKARPVTTLCLTVCGTACRSTAAPLPLRSSQKARFYPKVRESLPPWDCGELIVLTNQRRGDQCLFAVDTLPSACPTNVLRLAWGARIEVTKPIVV